MTDDMKQDGASEGQSASKAMLSGVLDSPYGEFTIYDPSSLNDRDLKKKRYYNGHRVENQRLVGEAWEHTVPSHWIKPDNDGGKP